MRDLKFMLLGVIFAVASICDANLITNPGFEQNESTYGYPSRYGDWSGDCTSIIGSSYGVVPYEGFQMLRFEYSGWESEAQSYTISDLYQLINISEYSSLVASGNAVVNASAYFNRVAFDDETDTQFFLRVYACTGSSNKFHPSQNVLDSATEYIETDSDLSSWEEVSIEFDIPVDTDYLAILVSAVENIHNDTSYLEFHGHYADCVSLEIVPEPTTIAILAIGCVMLRRKRK